MDRHQLKKALRGGHRVLLEGWLKPYVCNETYTQGVYDSDYHWTYDSDINVHVIGFYNKDYSGGIPLAETLYDNLQEVYRESKRYKISVGVRYHLSTQKKSWEELTTNMLNSFEGLASAKWGHHFSDLTGYLWTDQEFIVNKHDLISEIGTQLAGKSWKYEESFTPQYLLIEIFFQET